MDEIKTPPAAVSSVGSTPMEGSVVTPLPEAQAAAPLRMVSEVVSDPTIELPRVKANAGWEEGLKSSNMAPLLKLDIKYG